MVGTRTAAFAPLGRSASSSSTRSTTAATSRTARRATTRAGSRAGGRRCVGARVVLGSATPDLVTPRPRPRRPRGAGPARRAAGRAACRRSRSSTCAPSWRAAIGRSSRRRWPTRSASLRPGREQAVLLINRRGAATFILCRDCGESLRCPDCELPFVYHLDGGTLRCHHCGRSGRARRALPGVRQQPASATSAPGPSASRPSCARVSRGCASARLDSDALAARRGFETVYDDFREGRIDVLVGHAAGGEGPRPAGGHAGRGGRRRRHAQPARLPRRRAHVPAAGPGRRARRSRADAGAGDRSRPTRPATTRCGPRPRSTSTASPTRSSCGAGCSAIRRSACWPGCSSRDADRGRAEERGRQAAAAVAAPGVEVLGPLPSYVARRAGRYRFQVVVRAPDADARARGARAGAARGGHRRRSRVAALSRYNADRHGHPPHPDRRGADPARAHEARLDASMRACIGCSTTCSRRCATRPASASPRTRSACRCRSR